MLLRDKVARMIRSVGPVLIASLWLAAVAPPAAAQIPAPATTEAPADMPPWMRRGLPAAGHAALAPLVGKWRVRLSIHATFGRSPDAPPITPRTSSASGPGWRADVTWRT
jgi:hypothetical protein